MKKQKKKKPLLPLAKTGRLAPVPALSLTPALIPVSWLRPAQIVVIVVALFAGCYFRLVNLDSKVYWFDEVRTMIALTGRTYASLARRAFNGEIVHPGDLLKLVKPLPGPDAMPVVNSLLSEGVSSTHPPLYFVLAKWWQAVAGDDPVKLRLLAAIFGIAMLPAIFLLVLELFDLDTATLTLVLTALSPLQVIFCKDARNYSLWGLLLLLSGLFLVKALKTGRKRFWVLYAISAALGLYTHFLMATVLTGFAIFVIADQKFKLTKIVKLFAVSTACAVATMIPWLVLWGMRLISSGGSNSTPWFFGWEFAQQEVVGFWFADAYRIFWDVAYKGGYSDPLSLFAWPVFALEVWSIIYLSLSKNSRAKIFTLSLFISTIVVLGLMDAFSGGIWSTMPRYLLPTSLALIMAVSYLLVSKAVSGTRLQQALFLTGVAFLIGLEVFSCFVSMHVREWWISNVLNHELFAMAQGLNNQSNPILVATDNTYTTFGEMITTSRFLLPKVRIILTPESVVPNLSGGRFELYVFEPSQRFLTQIANKYHANAIPIKPLPGLFQLINQ